MQSISIASSQGKAAAFLCPFYIPEAESLGWLLHMQEAIKTQGEFCTWKGFSRELKQASAALSKLQRNNGCTEYLMKKWWSTYDIARVLQILTGICLCLGGYAGLHTQLCVCTCEKRTVQDKNRQNKTHRFWPNW